MASFTTAPLVPIKYLRPKRARFDVAGGAIEGGANLLGESVSMEMTGGGQVTCAYEECVIEADDTERHEVINWLGARGNGGFRLFTVEIINDWAGPFPLISGAKRPLVTGVPHSDGSLFSDGSGYSQATVWGEVVEMVNTGVLRVRMFGLSRQLRWSDWFSIFHPTKGWRAYRYWEVVDKTDEANPVYTLALAPPLREAVTVGTRLEFARPKCVMRFPRGYTLPWEYEGKYSSRPTLQFVEAF